MFFSHSAVLVPKMYGWFPHIRESCVNFPQLRMPIPWSELVLLLDSISKTVSWIEPLCSAFHFSIFSTTAISCHSLLKNIHWIPISLRTKSHGPRWPAWLHTICQLLPLPPATLWPPHFQFSPALTLSSYCASLPFPEPSRVISASETFQSPLSWPRPLSTQMYMRLASLPFPDASVFTTPFESAKSLLLPDFLPFFLTLRPTY